MKLTFFSSVLGYHQEGLCNAFYNILGDDFHFVAYSDLPDFRKAAGFKDLADVYPYVIKAYTEEGKAAAEELMKTSDVAIVGAASNDVVKKCVDNKVETYLFSERFFKKGAWRAFIPTIRKKVKARAAGYKQKNFKALCASAYLPYDLSLCGWKGKAYKWGYFTDVKKFDVDELLAKKSGEGEPVRILWAARFLKLKHPESAIEVAEYLKKKNCNFQLDIIGYGELENKIRSRIKSRHLEDVVSFLGKKDVAGVHEAMGKADIFLMTSDYNEGWGVVVNESLNHGCAVVADYAAGAVHYMIEDGKNGFTYRKNIKKAFPVIERLVNDKAFRQNIQKNAYEYMVNEAAPEVVARRFVQMCRDGSMFEDGFCSRSPIIKSKWF